MSEVKVDTISERTAAGGVTIDGVLIKDSVLKIPGGSPGADKILTSDASGNATWAAAADSALTVAQTFRETSNHTNGGRNITIGATNYEEADQAGYSSLGSITESAGVFTFPSTGRYLVMSVVAQSQAAAVVAYTYIQYSSDSAVSWTQQSNAFVTFTTSATYSNSICHAVVNIADISTDRVQVLYDSTNLTNTIYGDSGMNSTYTTLIKLA